MRPTRIQGANSVLVLESDDTACEHCGGSGSEECPGCWGSGRRGDLPIRVDYAGPDVTVLRSGWQPDEEDRAALAAGALVELGVWVPPQMHPPVSMAVGEAREALSLLPSRAAEEAAMELARRVAGGLGGRVPEKLGGVPLPEFWERLVQEAM